LALSAIGLHKANTPFAPEAYRVENGVKYAGEGCANTDCAVRTQKIMLHPDLKTSVAAVDEEAGAVLLWMNFGNTHSYGLNNPVTGKRRHRLVASRSPRPHSACPEV
jgi:hypothetical protein